MKPRAQFNSAEAGKKVEAERCAKGRSRKPTFTRPRAGASGPYVASKWKTNLGMLHQSQALKAPAADKARDRSETGGGCGESRTLAGNMVEVCGAEQAAPVTSIRSKDGESGRKANVQGRVFVLGKRHQPLMPCHPARARKLLNAGRAVIVRTFPLVIRLKKQTTGTTQPVVYKLDPGAKTTGIAVVRVDPLNPSTQHIVFTAELAHRGFAIRDSLIQRASFRRARRARKTRYRSPRFLNRRRGKRMGWLPPSLRHRIETISSWTTRLRRFAPISGIGMELVRFDLQKIEAPDIAGAEYQQGELAGYEVREYLLEKWGRCCAYCDAKNIPLQIEHIVPKARGGSNRVSNLTLACVRCNTKKGAQDIREVLARDPKRLAKILSNAKAPLASAAAVNATRFALLNELEKTGLPVTTSSGGRTKWNRTKLGLAKTHALDAACVGTVDTLTGTQIVPLAIKAMGRGTRQRTRLTAHGFPRGYLSPAKSHFGFRTGDIVKANVTHGKRTGFYFGRVAVRASGSFNIQTKSATIQGIAYRFCAIVQRADGYGYAN